MRLSFPLAILVVALFPVRAHAQDDFEAFRRKEAEKLRSYLSKEDRDFADHLKRDWTDFAAVRNDKPLERPKPRVLPTLEKPAPPPAPAPASTPPADAAPAAPAPLAVIPSAPAPGVTTTPAGRRSPGIEAPRPAPVLAGAPSSGALTAAFFGGVVAIPTTALKLDPIPATVTMEAIGAFWEQINASPYQDALSALQRERERMNLGDWAYAQAIFRSGLRLTNNDTTLARLITWHFLVKSGYAARVGFNGGEVQVLLRTDETLYGPSYFRTKQGKFYALDLAGGPAPKMGSIRTYEGDHPESTRPLTFNMATLPLLPEDAQSRRLRFSYGGKQFEFDVAVNRNLVRFLSNYPQTDLNGYLDADAGSSALDAIVDGLRPIISGRSEVESVDVILRFVQTAFDYKTDGDQFAREKWMFPEETLFYPYSDCEDRAILFTHLVRRLVPVSVVGLIYSDHVASAVRFTSNVQGDALDHKGARYVISDPTYINASVGMGMERYKNAAPTVVETRR